MSNPECHPFGIARIFILSKGRPNLRKGTCHLLIEDSIPFTIVVEPDEVQLYEAAMRNFSKECATPPYDETPLYKVVSLPDRNRGVSYARNFILDHLILPEDEQIWILDDDIAALSVASANRTVRVRPRWCFAEAHRRQRSVSHLPIALFALEYAQFGFASTSDAIALNSYCNIAVCLNLRHIPPNVRYSLRIREDYDFVLQLIAEGKCCVRFRNLLFIAPSMGTNPGGMTPYYKNKLKDIRLQNKLFVQLWPGVATEVIKRGGYANQRYDIRVRWGALSDPRTAPDIIGGNPHRARLLGDMPPEISEDLGSDESSNELYNESSTSSIMILDENESGDDDDEFELVDSEGSNGSLQLPMGTKRARSPSNPEPTDGNKATSPKGFRFTGSPTDKGWKGFGVVIHREITSELIDSANLVEFVAREGEEVYFIPIDDSEPVLIKAVVLLKSRRTSQHNTAWTYHVAPQLDGLDAVFVDNVYKVKRSYMDSSNRLRALFNKAKIKGSKYVKTI